MLINLRNAVLSLVAGSMFVTSAQAGHFGGMPKIGGGGGGGFASTAKAMGNFNQPASKNFGSPQTMVQRSSGSGSVNNSFKNQGTASFAKGLGQNNNVLNQVKNNTSQSTVHNPFQNTNLSGKLNSNNATSGGSQTLFGKLNQKNGATNPTGAVGNTTANAIGNSHQSFMDKLNNKNNGQTQENATKNGTTTPTGVNGTMGTGATQTANNASHKNTHDLGIDTNGVNATATNLQNQVNTGIQQTQGNANTPTGTGGATNVGVGTATNANPGNIGGTTGNGGANTGTAGTGGTTGGNGGMGTGTGGMNGGNTNVNNFGGGGFLPTFLGTLAGTGLANGIGGGFGGGAGGGYAGPAYVDSAPQYVEAPTPQYVQSTMPSAPATLTPISAVSPVAAAAVGSPMITSVEPLQGAESQVLVRGSGFGTAGNLALDVNGVQLVLEVSAWTPNAIIAKVPTLNVANDAAIHFTAVRTDGASSQPFDPSAPTVVASR